jgi:hypothetical protein
LFIAFSVLWFTELLWILQKPNISHIIIHGLLLFLCFAVRNNAYIYPFVSIAAFALVRLQLWVKLSGGLLGLLLIIPFIIHTRKEAYKVTGTNQFSLFTGWQLANNALYIYEFTDTNRLQSARFRELEKLTLDFYGILPEGFRSYLFSNPGNYFIQRPQSPLKIYFSKNYSITNGYSNISAWGKSSAVFSEYGSYIIKHNPGAYFHEFMLPNTKNYFIPHLEKLEVYNLGMDKVDPIAQKWFNYKSNRINAISINGQGIILYIFPFLFLVANIHLLINLISFWIKDNYHSISFTEKNHFNLFGILLLLNFSFSVFATIIVMRYQIFPMIISLSFTLLLTEWLNKKYYQANSNKHT